VTEQDESAQKAKLAVDWREFTAVVLLSITAIVTAWSGFQSSKWGGAMSISFSQASTARLEAARGESDANRQIAVQVNLYTAWSSAYANDQTALAEYLASQFPEPLASSFKAWRAADPENNPEVPRNPFDMPQYQPEGLKVAAEADARADAKFQQALDNNQRGDNYTLLTVIFALVLFFAAVSGRIASPRNQWILLGLAGALFVAGLFALLAMPKLV